MKVNKRIKEIAKRMEESCADFENLCKRTGIKTELECRTFKHFPADLKIASKLAEFFGTKISDYNKELHLYNCGKSHNLNFETDKYKFQFDSRGTFSVWLKISLNKKEEKNLRNFVFSNDISKYDEEYILKTCKIMFHKKPVRVIHNDFGDDILVEY